MTFLFPPFHFLFFCFGHFWRQSYENTKILRNLCLHFARQDGQDGKKPERKHATKVTKIPKTKRRKCGMNETLVKIKDDNSFNKCIPVFCVNVVIRDGGGEPGQGGQITPTGLSQS